jgi:hypothetical protein
VDFTLLAYVLSAAVTLAGWVLFVVLWIKFRQGEANGTVHRSAQPAMTSARDVEWKDLELKVLDADLTNPVDHQKNGVQAMSDSTTPTVTIRVSGRLFETHLTYLNQLVQSAVDCRLWAVLDLAMLAEADLAAVRFLARGEGRDFGITSCPPFLREWMERDRIHNAA